MTCVGHDLGLLGDLARERACVLARLVDDDRERRLQGVRQVADVGAGALDDVLVGFEERVELLLQRLDLLRQVRPRAVSPRPSGWRPGPFPPCASGKQAEPDLEQGDGEQADAGQRQRQAEPGAEVEQAGFHLAQRAGDGNGVALCRLPSPNT